MSAERMACNCHEICSVQCIMTSRNIANKYVFVVYRNNLNIGVFRSVMDYWVKVGGLVNLNKIIKTLGKVT